MNRLTLHAAILAAAFGSAVVAQSPAPLADLVTNPARNGPTTTSNTVDRCFEGNVLYMRGEHDIFGSDPIATDGNTIGLLGGIELAPGESADQPYPRDFVSDGLGNVYFTGYTGNIGREIYRWNGIQTVLVDDTLPGNPLGTQIDDRGPVGLYAWNGAIYYSGFDGVNGRELWKTDGVTTTIVDEINPGPGSGVSQTIAFEPLGAQLFFLTDPGQDFNFQLFKTFGIPGLGTTVLCDPAFHAGLGPIDPFSGLASKNGPNGALRAYGSNMMFNGSDWSGYTSGAGNIGRELLQYNGTNVVLGADINPGVGNGSPGDSVNFNGKLYFQADNGVSGREVWSWDGAAATQVFELNTSGSADPANSFCVNNGKLFFRSNVRHPNFSGVNANGQIGHELCIWDGSPVVGMYPTTVIDIRPGTGNGLSSSDSSLRITAASPTKVVFMANDGTTGNELWESDGTPAGTILTGDFAAGTTSGLSAIWGALPTVGDGRVFVSADDPTGTAVGNDYPGEDTWLEIWIVDLNAASGVAGVQSMVDDYNRNTPTATRGGGISGSYVHDTGQGFGLAPMGGNHPTSTTSTDVELYRFNSSTLNLQKIAEIRTNGSSVNGYNTATGGRQSATCKGRTFFAGRDNSNKADYYWTNGNPAVVPTKIPVNSTGASSVSNNFSMERYLNGVVMFEGLDGGTRASSTQLQATLIASNGGAPGYVVAQDYASRPNRCQNMKYYHNHIYFTSQIVSGLDSLWIADASDTSPIVTGGTIADYWFVDSKIYMARDDGISQQQLWSCDLDGTNLTQVSNITLTAVTDGQFGPQINTFGHNPLGLAKIGNRIVYMGIDNQFIDNDASGDFTVGDTPVSLYYQPFWTDGVTTNLVSTITPEGPNFLEAVALDAGLVFTYDTPAAGMEIFKSNGFPGGTGIVKDITLGAADGSPGFLTKVSGRIAVFRYGAGTITGQELYTTNGFASGTYLAKSVSPGNGDAVPGRMSVVDGVVIFSAENPEYGQEPHVWNPPLGFGNPVGISSVPDLPVAAPLRMFTQDGVMGSPRTLDVRTVKAGAAVLTTWSVAGAPESNASGGFHHVYIGVPFFTLDIGVDGDLDGIYTTNIIWPSSPALVGVDVMVQSFSQEPAAPKKTTATNGYIVTWGLV